MRQAVQNNIQEPQDRVDDNRTRNTEIGKTRLEVKDEMLVGINVSCAGKVYMKLFGRRKELGSRS